MSKQIIPLKLNNLQRRELAHKEMQSYSDSGLFRYLLHSQHIRHAILPDGTVGHSIIDILDILNDITTNPRRYWSDMKRRLLREDNELYEQIVQLKLPSQTDGKHYQTDVINTGWLFFLLTGIRSPITDRIRSAFAADLNRFDRQHHAAIISELDREIGWAGTETKLLMAENYEEGDYDNPVQPPGTPK